MLNGNKNSDFETVSDGLLFLHTTVANGTILTIGLYTIMLIDLQMHRWYLHQLEELKFKK